MRERIIQELRRIESARGVRVLYACESGSRAWGFASTDSDYDVRFLYVRPTPWYLSIRPGRDVLELPLRDNLDVSGWDLPKALGLLQKSNPPLLEWLQSPTVYLDRHRAADRLRALLPEAFRPKGCVHHYLSMARNNYREHMRGEQVRLKKYFYVLRPVMACLWIEKTGTAAPTEFARLVDACVTDAALREAIDELRARKTAGDELRTGPRIPAINAFLERELERLEAFAASVQPTPRLPAERLDDFFRRTLLDVWGPWQDPGT